MLLISRFFPVTHPDQYIKLRYIIYTWYIYIYLRCRRCRRASLAVTRYTCLLICYITFDLPVTVREYAESISKERYERAENNDDGIITRCEEIFCKFYHTHLLIYKA